MITHQPSSPLCWQSQLEPLDLIDQPRSFFGIRLDLPLMRKLDALNLLLKLPHHFVVLLATCYYGYFFRWVYL